MQMNASIFSVKACITTAWNNVSGAKKSIWAAIGITVLIGLVISIIAGVLTPISKWLGLIVNLIGLPLNTLLQVGLIYIGIQRAKDAPINYKQIFYTFNLHTALQIIGVYVIQFAIFLPLTLLFFTLPTIILGTIMIDTFHSGFTLANFFLVSWFIFGAIVMFAITLRLLLALAYVLDKGVNAWQAIKLSFASTKGHELKLLALVLTQFLSVFVGFLLLGIGLIWAIPFALILYGTVYKTLVTHA